MRVGGTRDHDGPTRKVGLGLAAVLSCAVAVLAGWAQNGMACDVPVFRYALERWEAAPFLLTVFHAGPLAAEQKALFDRLTAAAESNLNLRTQEVDVNGTLDEETKKLWSLQKGATAPWMAMYYPPREWGPALNTAWAGPLNQANVTALLDSPARRRIVRALLEGKSAVWVVVPSGDAKADAAPLAALERLLRQAEKEMPLPTPGPNDPVISTKIPLKLEFTTVQVSPTDPNEAVFLDMLANSAAETAIGTGQPTPKKGGLALYPVFGRGRLLVGLPGSEVNEESVVGIVGFLCGSCSCEIKEQNPGVDLLMSAGWDQAVWGSRDEAVGMPPLISLATMAGAAGEAGATSAPSLTPRPATAKPPMPPAAAGKPAATETSLIRGLVGVVAVLVLLAVAGSIFILRRR